MDFDSGPDIFGEAKTNHKIVFLLLGFFTVIAIIFSFQAVGNKIKGIKNNYNALFCANIK